MAQTTIFDDTFGGSTLNTASGFNSSTAGNYDVVSTKAMTAASISSGDLNLNIGASSGNGYQIQALFASSPVTLTTVGDYIQLLVTFTDTGGVLATNGATLVAGMYKSGGVGPLTGGVSDETTSSNDHATGGAQGWIGYAAQIATNHSYILTRSAQTSGTFNNNQDVLFGNGAGSVNSSTKGYASPNATLLGNNNGSTFLTLGSQYTMALTYTLTGANTLAIETSLYTGVGTGGAQKSDFTATDSSASNESFDALATGLYLNKNGLSTLDFNQIEVNDLIQQVPEPSVFALAGLGLIALAQRLRRR